MSKRDQTTGMPKAGALKPTPKPEASENKSSLRGRLQPRLLNEYQSKHERQNALQRLIIIGIAALAALSLVILIISFGFDQLVTPNQVVAEVNGQSITVGEFRSRVRLERAILNETINGRLLVLRTQGATDEQVNQVVGQSPEWNELQVSDQLGNRVLNDMIDDILLAQAAQTAGVTVDAISVEQQINAFFGYDPEAALSDPTATPTRTASPTPFITPTATVTPTVTPTPEMTSTATLTPQPTSTPTNTPDATQRAQTFTERRGSAFDTIQRTAGIDQNTLRAYFEAQALRKAFANTQFGESSGTTTYANARHILVESEALAQDTIAALNNGDSFAELARALSTDTGSGAQGGELGWAPVANYVTEFAAATRDGEIGAILGPIQTEFGYHIIQVRAREERAATDAAIDQERATQLETYLETLRDTEGTTVEIFDAWVDNVPDEPRFVARY